MFAELARQFFGNPELGVELLPLNAPIINRYVLDNEFVRTRLAVWDAGHEYVSFARYFMRVQPRRHLDIVHNTFYLPHGLASYPGAKRIVTVHDMIPEVMPKTRRRLDFLTLKRRYVNSAHHVICVSEATKRDLLRVYGDITAPISVVHHGVDEMFRPGVGTRAELPDNYVLYVGNRSQYKDAIVLMRAFSSIHNDYPGLTLLFVGGGALTAAETRELARLGIAGKTLHLSLADEAMPAAYGNAALSVFPSHYEGFGLPAVEAMACGTPTILADATSLPEVGGDAAVYFAPGDDAELASAMRRVLEDPDLREDLRSRGLQRAAGFTWEKSARETLAVYNLALEAGR